MKTPATPAAAMVRTICPRATARRARGRVMVLAAALALIADSLFRPTRRL